MGRSIGIGTIAKGTLIILVLYVTDQLLTGFRHSELGQIERDTDAAIRELAETSDAIRELKKEFVELQLQGGDVDQQIKDLQKQVAAAKSGTSQYEKQNNFEVTPEPIAMPQGFEKNRVISTGVCKATDPTKLKKGLPKFIFVAGIEGSGHHALKDVWWSLEKAGLKLHLVVYDQLFHALGVENHASYHYSSIRKETYVERMGPIFEQAKKNGSIVIDAQNSYPMGKGAGALAHPDLMMLSELDGELFDLRVIVIYRDPVDASLSAVRRFQNNAEYLYKNFEFQARMVSECLANINNALPHLPCNRYMVIDYEKLVSDPRKFVGSLEELVGAKHDELHNAFTHLKSREKKPDSPEKAAQRAMLKSFFDIQKQLWPRLAQVDEL